jgi:hypothetical protein
MMGDFPTPIHAINAPPTRSTVPHSTAETVDPSAGRTCRVVFIATQPPSQCAPDLPDITRHSSRHCFNAQILEASAVAKRIIRKTAALHPSHLHQLPACINFCGLQHRKLSSLACIIGHWDLTGLSYTERYSWRVAAPRPGILSYLACTTGRWDLAQRSATDSHSSRESLHGHAQNRTLGTWDRSRCPTLQQGPPRRPPNLCDQQHCRCAGQDAGLAHGDAAVVPPSH